MRQSAPTRLLGLGKRIEHWTVANTAADWGISRNISARPLDF
jgi:hypothetical protein